MIVSVWDDGAETPWPAVTEPETVTVLSGASTALFTAVTVTVPVLVVWPAAIVSVAPASVKSPETAGDTADADTVTTTDALDAPLSAAVTVLIPPFSPIDDGLSTRLNVGAPSSSVIVSVWDDGAETPWPPVTEPETVTVLSDASTALFTAVTVTVPVLVVWPDAIVSVAPASVKSPETAGDTADADTVTTTDALDAPLSAAVTVLIPPFSPIDDGLSTRLNVGAPSSSVIVSVWDDGAETPWPPVTEPETVTVLSGASTALFTAVTVTVPVLVVWPDAIVSVAPNSVKSPETAGDTADAETVTTTDALDVPLSAAVTVLTPPFSPIDDGLSTRLNVGAPSSSVIVSVWDDGAETPWPPVTEPETVTVLSGASTALFTAVTVTVPVLVVWPDAIVSVAPASVKSPETAGDTADADTVTTTDALDAPLSVAVTRARSRRPRQSWTGISTSAHRRSTLVVGDRQRLGRRRRNPVAARHRTRNRHRLVRRVHRVVRHAVMVTVPVLVVWPDAIVSVAPASVKSPETAGDTADADTVTTTDALDAPLSVAVTVLTPPFSPIDDGLSTRLNVGAPSSAVIVSVWDDGETPWPPVTEPETVTVLSGASSVVHLP